MPNVDVSVSEQSASPSNRHVEELGKQQRQSQEGTSLISATHEYCTVQMCVKTYYASTPGPTVNLASVFCSTS